MLTRTNSFPKNTNSPPPVTALTPTTGPRRNCPIFARLTARVDGVVGEGGQAPGGVFSRYEVIHHVYIGHYLGMCVLTMIAIIQSVIFGTSDVFKRGR